MTYKEFSCSFPTKSYRYTKDGRYVMSMHLIGVFQDPETKKVDAYTSPKNVSDSEFLCDFEQFVKDSLKSEENDL